MHTNHESQNRPGRLMLRAMRVRWCASCGARRRRHGWLCRECRGEGR